jgi:DNA-binding winged helix-turn-helix (wHTH) protein
MDRTAALKAELLQGFYLGDVLIEPLKRQVTGRGFAGHLTPNATEVLLQLACTPGSLVTRERLLETVWGEGHGTTEELSQAVGQIRSALHDSVDDPQYIQTLPQRGYRLILEPRLLDEHTSSIVLGAGGGPKIDGLGLRRTCSSVASWKPALPISYSAGCSFRSPTLYSISCMCRSGPAPLSPSW